jgi:hypothetical protein
MSGSGEWRRSSFCESGACVEVRARYGGELVELQDSTDEWPRLMVTAEAWDAFIEGVKVGEFDRDKLGA